jgi:hypothetical protein
MGGVRYTPVERVNISVLALCRTCDETPLPWLLLAMWESWRSSSGGDCGNGAVLHCSSAMSEWEPRCNTQDVYLTCSARQGYLAIVGLPVTKPLISIILVVLKYFRVLDHLCFLRPGYSFFAPRPRFLVFGRQGSFGLPSYGFLLSPSIVCLNTRRRPLRQH